MNLRLDWCSYEAAKYAVEHWHYSRRMPLFKRVQIGVWEDGKFIGCVMFGRSITPHLGDMFNLSCTQVIELTRIALTKHKTPVSRITAIAIKMVNKQSPGLRLLVSYADPKEGHNGGIYQAMNWIYIWKSAKLKQYYFRGDWRNDTPLFRLFRDNPEIKKSIDTRNIPEKYKYLYPLDNEMRKQIEPLRKPYPKRGQGETDNAAGSNLQTEGASPICPLLIE
jgi:hypothetical protein